MKLSGKPSVDKSELQAAYDKYKDKKNDGYTAESWAKFENALKSAKAILDNEAATADQVKAALAQLNSAAEGLTKTQTPPKNDPQTPSTPSQGGRRTDRRYGTCSSVACTCGNVGNCLCSG